MDWKIHHWLKMLAIHGRELPALESMYLQSNEQKNHCQKDFSSVVVIQITQQGGLIDKLYKKKKENGIKTLYQDWTKTELNFESSTVPHWKRIKFPLTTIRDHQKLSRKPANNDLRYKPHLICLLKVPHCQLQIFFYSFHHWRDHLRP